MDTNFDFWGEHPKRVLIIDDDQAYAEMTREILRDKLRSYDLTVANDGYEASILVSDLRPDLVVLDLMTPGMDGFRVVGLISNGKTDHPMKITVLRGKLPTAAIERLTSSKADHWLAEPVADTELLHSVMYRLSNEDPGVRGIS